jgi:hypothetical protein
VNSPACFCKANICGLFTINTLIDFPPPPPPPPPDPPAPAQADAATNNTDKPAAAATFRFQRIWSHSFLVVPLQGLRPQWAVRGLVAQPHEEHWLHARLRTGGRWTHSRIPSVTSGAECDQNQCSEQIQCSEQGGPASSRSGHVDRPTDSTDAPLRRPWRSHLISR